MKKFKLFLLGAYICLSLLSVQTNAMTTLPPVTAQTETSAAPNPFTTRLAEIEAMDKSKLTFKEKRALRKEVRSIKKEARSTVTGVYIPIGALVIIILLLVIFL